MKALILAAGRGSRLGNLTDDGPKCLLKLWGKTLLEWQLAAFRDGEIEEVGVVRGYKRDSLSRFGLSFFENEEWAATNMVSSLVCADSWLTRDTCIVSYADIVYSGEVIRKIKNSPGDIAITYNTQWLKLWSQRFANPLEDVENFQITSTGDLTLIGGRAMTLDSVQGQYMGVLKFTPKGWLAVQEYLNSIFPVQVKKLDMTSLLSVLLKRGVKIHCEAIEGNWYEVDNESDLRLYESWPVPFHEA